MRLKNLLKLKKYRKNNADGYVDVLMRGIEKVSKEEVKRSALRMRFVLSLGVMKHWIFYMKNLKKTKRYLFDLILSW